VNDSNESRNHAKWAALIIGMAFAFPVVMVLIRDAPWLLLALATTAFLGWIGVRTGWLDGGTDEDTEADPLMTLQKRYAAGELSEAEFERRLDRILESDEVVERAAGGRLDRDRPAGEPLGRDPAPGEGPEHDPTAGERPGRESATDRESTG